MDIKKILFKTCEIDAAKMFPDAVIMCNKEGKVIWLNDRAESLIYPKSINDQVSDILENGFNMLTSATLLNKPMQVKMFEKSTYLDMTVRETDDVYILSLRESCVTTAEEQNEDYKVINRDKNNFLIKLTNDFKSPLQSIIGFSQAIADGLGGTISVQQDKYIKIIKKNSTDLMYFVEKLIMLSQTEIEHKKPNMKTFDILNCIKTLARYNMQLNKDKSVKINIEADDTVKNTFVSDEELIKQIIQNTIEVILGSVEMGEIIIRMTTPSEEICQKMNIKNDSLFISISSSSFLLSESELENIFDPYKMIDTSNRKNLLRAIILSSIKNLVQCVGGYIWADTKPLKETGFCLLLPQSEI